MHIVGQPSTKKKEKQPLIIVNITDFLFFFFLEMMTTTLRAASLLPHQQWVSEDERGPRCVGLTVCEETGGRNL